MYFVYIIASLVNKQYYISQTDNLDNRIERHNNGLNKSTKAYRPWELRWWNEYETRSEAVIIETKLKKLKKREGIRSFVKKNYFRGVAQPG
jgi:putative endonuclease